MRQMLRGHAVSVACERDDDHAVVVSAGGHVRAEIQYVRAHEQRRTSVEQVS